MVEGGNDRWAGMVEGGNDRWAGMSVGGNDGWAGMVVGGDGRSLSFPRKRESRDLCDRKAGIGRAALDSWSPIGVGDGLRGNDVGAVDSRENGNDRWAAMAVGGDDGRAGMTGGWEWWKAGTTEGRGWW